jgi:hypothetical protein
MFKPRPHRIVRLTRDYPYLDYARFQLNFLDPVRREILPSTRVYQGPELIFESNALGCKGPELEDGRPIVGVFGDSTVQGGGAQAGYPGHVWIGGAQPLNGGVEGSTLSQTVDRFLKIQAQAPMICVALHTGWHDLVYGDNTEDDWRQQLDRVQGPPVIAHFRLVSDFHPEALAKGYDRFFKEDVYWRWQDGLFNQPEHLAAFAAAQDRFNTFIEAYCMEQGRVLIDLDPVLQPRSYENIAENFLDLIHPRQETYPRLGQAVADQLSGHVLPLAPLPEGRFPGPWEAAPAAAAPEPGQADKGGPKSDMGRNYPLF